VRVRGRFATKALCSILSSFAPPRSRKLPAIPHMGKRVRLAAASHLQTGNPAPM
jgi:hypothetical protein